MAMEIMWFRGIRKEGKQAKKGEKELKELDKRIQKLDEDIKSREQVRIVKVESIVDKEPGKILDFFIDQFKGAETFEVDRVNFFSRKNKALYGKLSSMKELKHLRLRE
jgi:hypothetical protein